MYVAKQAGKGRYEVFEDEMHRQVRARTGLARDLRSAVAERQLRLLYQPQIDLSSGRMVGVEALVRWEHPERGLLTPDRFIPLAESTGMIVDIDDWVIREACAQMRAWDEAGLESLAVAVNVSAHRLVSGDLAGTVAAVLHDTAADPARLEIELTETVAVEPDSDAVRAIRRVRELGVQVAIDDFGMGHSALSRLQTFPVDRLKIDKSFVAPLTHGPEGASIAAAMIAMARSLDLLVVAEGVETQEQLAALMSLGCECAQGYLFSKPVPPAQIARLAQDQADFVGDWTEGIAAPGPSEAGSAELVRSLLSELQRLTGLDTTYLTRVDRAREAQHVTHSRNTAMLDIPEGLTVAWSDTLCRRALEQGISYTDDVPSSFPDSEAAAMLGLRTYVTVPLVNADGDLEGTLCGASRNRVALGPETLRVMERFAALISQADGQKAASANAAPGVAPTSTGT
ncbi:MAG: EAL domain-containing protein [Actinomycetota bacterium]|nr:EAL domain-containing protein [Actinomycetota bacterium]